MGKRASQYTMIEEFAAVRRRQWIATGIVIPVLLGAMFLVERDRKTPGGRVPVGYAVAGVVLVVGLLAFSLWNWRCPSCRAYLGRGLSPRFCRHCGQQLRE